MKPAFTNRQKRMALNKLLTWAYEYAFKGSMHPEDHDNVDLNYLRAINRLEFLLDLPKTEKLKE